LFQSQQVEIVTFKK